MNTEEGKGENNQERRNGGKEDGEGRRNVKWKQDVEGCTVAGISVSSNLCSGMGVSACR